MQFDVAIVYCLMDTSLCIKTSYLYCLESSPVIRNRLELEDMHCSNSVLLIFLNLIIYTFK